MTKVVKILKVLLKTTIVGVIVCGLFLNLVYTQSLKNDIASLKLSPVTGQEDLDKKATLSLRGLLLIIEQLEYMQQTQEYILDQNRPENKIEKVKVQSEEVKQNKPTYEELKAHNVYIEGCAKQPAEDGLDIKFLLGEDEVCWSGTGTVIKITDTDTYILTNNHVAGKDETDVTLTVENGMRKVKAEVVKYHNYVDAAVIRIPGKLKNKTAIPGIAYAQIQEPVYVVGNPLGVKNVYTEGVVAGYNGISMLIQMPCIYGNSGSGVFDKDGNLVALVFAMEQYPGPFGLPSARITHSLVVDSISLKPFLKDLGLI